MNRTTLLVACSAIFISSANANTPVFPFTPITGVQFSNALTEEQLARESHLNVSPDSEMLKANRSKGDAVRKASVNIFGSVNNNVGSPLCGLILANGVFQFSCAPTGSYSLTVPLDSAGQVTLFGFVDGHFPYKVLLNSGGRWDMNLNIASGGGGGPPVTTTSVITFTITDGCNNGIPIDYKFYDETNHLVWPSSTTHYSTTAYNGVYAHNLTCNNNALVCYGGRSVTYYWGVDLDNSKTCTDCCISCQSGNSLSRRLAC